MARVVELVVLLNALGGLSAFGLRYWHRRFRSPRERIADLERENAEIDEALTKMHNRSRDSAPFAERANQKDNRRAG